MTDKQKIKEEIEKRLSLLWDLIPKGEKVLKDDFTKDDANNLGKYTALESLLQFIDSIPEEPKCIYNRTLDERKKFCKYCSAACDVRIEEEPVSEDLEEAAKHYLYGAILYDDVYVGNPTEEDCIRCFKAGAEWQRRQDEKLFKDDSWNYIEENYPNISQEEKLRLYDVSIKSRLAGANTINGLIA